MAAPRLREHAGRAQGLEALGEHGARHPQVRGEVAEAAHAEERVAHDQQRPALADDLERAGAPSPLYGIYRAQLRFSATTLTAVFAIYALVLLLTLLVFGSVSDYLGRRRVILAALTVTAGACAVFLAAHSVGLLFAARALQGLAVGAATGALGAALIDLQPGGSGLAPLVTTAAPTLGLGAGALGTSALAQYGPAPTRLVWWLLLGASAAAAAAILVMPEPGTRRAGALASLRPRVGVPRQARGTFAAAVPCLIARTGVASRDRRPGCAGGGR